MSCRKGFLVFIDYNAMNGTVSLSISWRDRQDHIAHSSKNSILSRMSCNTFFSILTSFLEVIDLCPQTFLRFSHCKNVKKDITLTIKTYPSSTIVTLGQHFVIKRQYHAFLCIDITLLRYCLGGTPTVFWNIL